MVSSCFDKLSTSGFRQPLVLSLSKDEGSMLIW
jgi:hypothetical protein